MHIYQHIPDTYAFEALNLMQLFQPFWLEQWLQLLIQKFLYYWMTVTTSLTAIDRLAMGQSGSESLRLPGSRHATGHACGIFVSRTVRITFDTFCSITAVDRLKNQPSDHHSGSAYY